MMRRVRLAAFLACGLSVFFAPRVGHAVIVSAGDLLVDLRLEDFVDGSATWANQGTLGGTFDLMGAASATVGVHGTGAGVTFNGAEAFQGPVAPAGITGAGTRSIEVWAYNPAVAGEETLVSLGRRGGPDGTNNSFNYGSSGAFGAVGHWGAPDMGWNGTPVAGQWHHLVYTYSGSSARVYDNGVLKNLRQLPLNTHGDGFIPADDGDFRILVGGQTNQTAPFPIEGGLRLSGAIYSVRVHDGVLSTAQVQNNYMEEAELFMAVAPTPFPPPPPPASPQQLTAGPKHRYTFNGDANDSVGTAHGTVVNPSNLDASFATVPGQLDLRANNNLSSNQNFTLPATRGAYVDLPNGTIKALGAAGPAQATFEAWFTTETNRTWARVFDFGRSDAGENAATGANSSRYLFFAPQAVSGVGGVARFAHRAMPAATFQERTLNDGRIVPTGGEHHMAVVWDEVAGTQTLYIDGLPLSAYEFDMRTNEFPLTSTNALLANSALGTLDDLNNWLGRAQFGDPLFDGTFNEFRIYDRALTAGQVLGNFQAGPDTVNVIPEPGTLIGALAVVALLALRRLRRQK